MATLLFLLVQLLGNMDRADLSTLLLGWYDAHRRVLPWRALPGEVPDPYRVWLSEIMLQQTTVATVRNRFEVFLQRWPTVAALAEADLDDVLAEWAGLGYYARARNLHKCAVHIASELDGIFPTDVEGLQALPGVGDYTSAAIAAIAFDAPATVVDGNVERVIARQFAIEDVMPAAKKAIKAAATTLTPADRPGDYAQALMDLGATICTPKKPVCALCPINASCKALKADEQERFPVKAPKKQRPTRRANIYCLLREGEGGPETWLRRRPKTGLLGGMLEFPSSPWQAEREEAVPLEADWQQADQQVVHMFTHFRLELTVHVALVVDAEPSEEEGRWVPLSRLDDVALPTVMKKVARAAFEPEPLSS